MKEKDNFSLSDFGHAHYQLYLDMKTSVADKGSSPHKEHRCTSLYLIFLRIFLDYTNIEWPGISLLGLR